MSSRVRPGSSRSSASARSSSSRWTPSPALWRKNARLLSACESSEGLARPPRLARPPPRRGQRSRHVAPHLREQRPLTSSMSARSASSSPASVERRLGQRQRAVVGDQVGEPVQRLRALRAGRLQLERLLEQTRGRAVRRRRSSRASAAASRRSSRRGTSAAGVSSAARSASSAAANVAPRASASHRGRLERRGHRLVGPVGRRGEVAGALLLAVAASASRAWIARHSARRRPLLDDRRDQRVAEAQPVAVAHQHVGGERRLEARRRASTRARRSAPASAATTRSSARAPAAARRPGAPAAAARRSRPGPGARISSSAISGLPRARVVQPCERGRGQPLAGPRVDEAPRAPRRRAARAAARARARRQAADERGQRLVRLARAHGGERPSPRRARAAAARRPAPPPSPRRATASRRSRAGPRPSQRTEQRPAGERDQPRVDRSVGVLEQQRHGERAPLRGGQRVEPVDQRLEQVVERGVGARRLGRGGPCPEHERLRCRPRLPRAAPSSRRRRRLR